MCTVACISLYMHPCACQACNVNQVEEDGWSALMIACLQGREEIARILVKEGADRNVVANDGTSLANAVVAVRNTVVSA